MATLLAIIEEVLDLKDRKSERGKVRIVAQCVVILGLGITVRERHDDARQNLKAGETVAKKLEALSARYPEGDKTLREEIRGVAKQIRESDAAPGMLMYSVYLSLQDTALKLEGMAKGLPAQLGTIESLARSSDKHAAAGELEAGKAYEEARRATKAAGDAQSQARSATSEAIAAKNVAGEARSEATAAKNAAVESRNESTQAKVEATAAKVEATAAKVEATAAKGLAGDAKVEAAHARTEATAAKHAALESKEEATQAKNEAAAAKGLAGDAKAEASDAKNEAIAAKNEAARARCEAEVTANGSAGRTTASSGTLPDTPDAGRTDEASSGT
ncbi:hypothetical protein K8640_17105 [Myxococcus sp. XM-1-1-1]|uniref:hypothetical protein n=1 Tax=Myxococcus sp. XM-1-1-1 TaxID=2874602 RepID=UPI001CBFD410|nr:hypothetical protein [Myxococcus sp. XM-1-1-1]MBZ4409925.1 hypothetical protein [Myxococcus sp. XM-1-1-1]